MHLETVILEGRIVAQALDQRKFRLLFQLNRLNLAVHYFYRQKLRWHRMVCILQSVHQHHILDPRIIIQMIYLQDRINRAYFYHFQH